jgi:hypothetical protein
MLLVTSPTGPAIRLDVPVDFHQVPLDPGTESRTAAQLEVVAALGLATRGQREAISLYLEALSIRLARGDVAGTAFCAVQLAGRPSTATLTVAMHETHTGDPGLVALGAAETMRRDPRFDRVEVLAVGGRPLVTATTERAAQAGDTPTAQVGTTVREISVLVPLTGQAHAAMLTLTTPSLDDWDTYRSLVLDISRSVRPASAA